MVASRLYAWLDSRLNLKSVEKTLLDEPIPGGASWIYVFGSATLFLFGLQALTGMFLAIYYAPTPDHAYDSVQFIENQVTFGWFVRGLHHWGASGMIIAVGLHMLQVFLYGAYKPPRELMWMVGVLLLLIVLAFAFTGYLLPWDQTAYWATQVGINMVGTVPLVGDFLIKVLRGGETLGALTLSRFFAVHVLFLPAVIVTGIALHMLILRRVGPAGPWDERKAASRRETFYPRQVYMDAVVMLLCLPCAGGLGQRGCRSRWRIRPIHPTPVSCRFRNGTFSSTMSYSNTSTDPLSPWSHGSCRSCSCSSSCSGRYSIGRKQFEPRRHVRSA